MEQKKVIALMCERAANLNDLLDSNGHLRDISEVSVVKFPCSGMIQPLMIMGAFKAGADGVIVCGCQIGDCYYREGNKMIRERLLGERPPTLKKEVDRRRILALWLSRVQKARFLAETKDFVNYVARLEPVQAAAAKPAAAPAPKPAPKPTPPPADTAAEGAAQADKADSNNSSSER